MLKDLQKLLKGSIIYGLGIAINQLLNIFLLPLFTKYLQPNDYGIASVLSTFSLVLYYVFSLGFGTSIGLIYYEKESLEHRNNTIWTSFYSLLILSFCVVITGFLFKDQISYLLFNNNDNKTFVLYTIISTFFTIIIIPFYLKLQFEEKQTVFVIITIINTVLSVFINVYFIIILKRGIQGRIEATTISACINFVLLLIPVIKNSLFKLNKIISISLIKYGLPVIPSFISLYILQQGNIYFLTKFHSLKLVGLYSIGTSFASGIMLLLTAFTTAFYPFAMSFINKKEEAKTLFGKIFTYYIFGVGLISLQFYIFAKPVVFLFTQPPFHESYKVIGLLSTAFFLLPVFNIMMLPIYWKKDIIYITIIQIISAILYIIFAIIVIKNFGLIGGAFALIFAYLILDTLTYMWCRINHEKYLQIVFEWGRIIKFLAFFILSVLLNHFIDLAEYPMKLIYITLIEIAFVFLISLLLKKEEKEWLTVILFKRTKGINSREKQ